MFARVTRMHMDPTRVDDAAALVRSDLVPLFEGLDGACHGWWMADVDKGDILAVTCWEDIGWWEASHAEVGRARTAIVEELDALPVNAENNEVYGVEHHETLHPRRDTWSRVIWAEGLNHAARGLAGGLFENTASAHREKPGFLSACWLADLDTGNGLAITTWDTADAIAADEHDSKKRRRQVSKALGCTIEGIQVYRTVGTSAGHEIDLRDSSAPESTVTSSGRR